MGTLKLPLLKKCCRHSVLGLTVFVVLAMCVSQSAFIASQLDCTYIVVHGDNVLLDCSIETDGPEDGAVLKISTNTLFW